MAPQAAPGYINTDPASGAIGKNEGVWKSVFCRNVAMRKRCSAHRASDDHIAQACDSAVCVCVCMCVRVCVGVVVVVCQCMKMDCWQNLYFQDRAKYV